MTTLGTPARLSSLAIALRRCRTGLLAVVFFSFFINVLLLASPLFMLQVFDRVLTSRSAETLLYLTLVATFAFVIMWGLDIVRGRIMISLGTWLDRQIGGDVLSSTLQAGLNDRDPTIQPLRDIAVFRNFLTGPALFPILDMPWTPIFLVVVFLLHPILGWIGLGGSLVLLVFAYLNDRTTRATLAQSGRSSAEALDEAQSAIRNADVISAMGMMPNVVARWADKMDDALIDQAQASRVGGIITATSKAIRQLLQVGLLAAGAWLVLNNELTAGGMIASSILIGRALAPVEQAISSWRSATGAYTAYQRIKHLLAVMPQAPEPDPLPAPHGVLKAEDISFAYPGGKEAFLKAIAFELEPGECLGLIGPTASGKTTLARILVGNLKPQLGHARLDGIDLAEWDPRDRGQYVGYLPQDVELFSGTVRENIARLGEGDPEAVYAAAQLAGVHEDILALPNGYETEIGDAGMVLSGGQRQRVGLARAVYGAPKLVVLDEPNSNLDSSGEAALLSALAGLKQEGCTVVIIAHRPGVLRNADKIVVLKKGTVEFGGSRDEVLAQLQGAEKQAPAASTAHKPPAAATAASSATPEPAPGQQQSGMLAGSGAQSAETEKA